MASSQVFISRKVRLSTCPRCGVSLWLGIADGLPFKVDPLPITLDGEVIARLVGRWSYAWEQWRRQCYYRDQFRMMKKPRPVVLVDHKCGEVLLNYIDVEHLGAISKVISDQMRNPEEEDETKQATEVEQNALISLGHILGAKVIDEECPF